MRLFAIAVGLCCATVTSAPSALAAPANQARASLAPADAVGPWTLESGGRTICVLDFGKEKVSAGSFALTVPMACGDALPSNLVAWAPAANGVRLVGFDDSAVMGFNRLSDGLLVSDHAGGAVLRMQRGVRSP